MAGITNSNLTDKSFFREICGGAEVGFASEWKRGDRAVPGRVRTVKALFDVGGVKIVLLLFCN